jgi:hypothetical protein
MVCIPGWDIITVNEVLVVVSLVLAEATVTRYPREGVGDGAVQVTSTVAAPVCSATKSVTTAEPTNGCIGINP